MNECLWTNGLDCKNPDNLKEGNFVNPRVCMLCLLGQLVEKGTP